MEIKVLLNVHLFFTSNPKKWIQNIIIYIIWFICNNYSALLYFLTIYWYLSIHRDENKACSDVRPCFSVMLWFMIETVSNQSGTTQFRPQESVGGAQLQAG